MVRCVLQVCQQGADQLFLISVSIPVIVLVAFLSWKFRPVPKTDDSKYFEDSDTGSLSGLAHAAL